jgi:transposase
VRYLGEIEATPAAVARLLRKLERKYENLHVCYEAGPTGSGMGFTVTSEPSAMPVT